MYAHTDTIGWLLLYMEGRRTISRFIHYVRKNAGRSFVIVSFVFDISWKSIHKTTSKTEIIIWIHFVFIYMKNEFLGTRTHPIAFLVAWAELKLIVSIEHPLFLKMALNVEFWVSIDIFYDMTLWFCVL